MKMVYNIGSVSWDVERDLFDQSVVPNVMCGVEIFGLRKKETQ